MYKQYHLSRAFAFFYFWFSMIIWKNSPSAKPKTASTTAKNSDSGVSKQKTVEIPTNIVKPPENANLSDLQHRASKITGLIMSNGLADYFKRGDESVMDMMKRIKEEISNDAIAEAWENKLEEFGVVFLIVVIHSHH